MSARTEYRALLALFRQWNPEHFHQASRLVTPYEVYLLIRYAWPDFPLREKDTIKGTATRLEMWLRDPSNQIPKNRD